jgi:hypothetical protein
MKITKKNAIIETINALEVSESINKKQLINSIWGSSDYFIERSFDVLFNNAKKSLPERKFKTEKGLITRTK